MNDPQKIRKEQLRECISQVQDYSLILYAFLYKANIEWTHRLPTAAVTADKRGRAHFYFNPDFWDKLAPTERLFLLLHECYHVFLQHFIRFKALTSTINAALDVAVNHSILRHYSFEDEDLPHIRVEGCWADTVLPDQVLLDSLSAEEYVAILQQNEQQVQYNQFDDHNTSSSDGSLTDIIKRVEEDLKDLFPDMSEKDIKKEIEKFNKEAEKMAGSESGDDKQTGDVLKKKENPWRLFARRLQKDMFKLREEPVWLPNKRLRHLEREGMFIPSSREEEVLQKVNVVLLLDTSGSCSQYTKHFLGFARALPEEFFNVHAFGFTTSPYPIDIKKPRISGGGTSFDFFQDVFDQVKGRKIAFVFTDGEGSPCKLITPEVWNWFMFPGGYTSYIHSRSRIYNLSDFE